MSKINYTILDCLECMNNTVKKEDTCAGCSAWFYLNQNFTGKENELSKIILRYINEGIY